MKRSIPAILAVLLAPLAIATWGGATASAADPEPLGATAAGEVAPTATPLPAPRVVPDAHPRAVITTSLGAVTIELDPVKAPLTVANFLEYARSGYFEGTVFHRVIPGFMIQGGGLLPDLEPKPGQRTAIVNEAANGLANKRGTLAMARTSVPDSATSQFFINIADNAFLDHRDNSPAGMGYAVFGRVVDGQDVVDKIAGQRTASRGLNQDVPVTAVVIESVKVLPAKP